MEKRKICKICDKSYANGKALGGHMRSHFITLPLPPKPNPAPPVSSPPPPPLINSLRKSNGLSSEANEYPSESKQLVAATTRRRSERRRRMTPVFAAAEAEKMRRNSRSGGSNAALSEEEAARFLMELSRDKWPARAPAEVEEEKEEEEQEQEEMAASERLIIRCETCHKEFSSHQALGGHKANHKRMKSHCKKALAISALVGAVDEEVKAEAEEELAVAAEEEEEEEKERVFQCEYCFKVFGSGKALGGHKKAHFSTHLPRNALSPNFGGTLVIDLNFPPPPPNDDDDEQREVQVQVIRQKGFSTLLSN